MWMSMTRAGCTSLSATVAGRNVGRLPVECNILPGPPDYAASRLDGPGIGSVAVGGTVSVRLELVDAFRNAVNCADVPEDVQHWEVRPSL